MVQLGSPIPEENHRKSWTDELSIGREESENRVVIASSNKRLVQFDRLRAFGE
jgi:hypothetical protein